MVQMALFLGSLRIFVLKSMQMFCSLYMIFIEMEN